MTKRYVVSWASLHDNAVHIEFTHHDSAIDALSAVVHQDLHTMSVEDALEELWNQDMLCAVTEVPADDSST